MRRLLLAVPAVLVLGLTAVGMDFRRSADGTAIDLPLSEARSNTAGSDGAGLCVYASGRHAAVWQNVTSAYGIQKWMEKRPGGSYPEKLDATLATYFAEKGAPVPAYFQHTGGDEQVLDLLVKTRRMPCITYAGHDDFYGTQTIAHMVNVVALDGSVGAILDNNRPSGVLWMTRKELLDRWRGVDSAGRSLTVRMGSRYVPVGGGWVWGWLAPPPPPVVGKRAAPEILFGCEQCSYCGGGCTCEAGKCPSQCWVSPKVGQCANGQCAVPLGTPPSDEYEWRQFDDGTWGWRFKLALPAVKKDDTDWNKGVVVERLPVVPEYAIKGIRCTRTQFIAAVLDTGGLVDDSDKYHLSVVSDDKAAIDALFGPGGKLAKYASRLHVQVYAADSWVARDRLKAKVTLQEPAKIGGKIVASGDDVEKTVRAAFELPEAPAPTPKPEPTPSPLPDPTKPAGIVWILVIGFLVWILAKKG